MSADDPAPTGTRPDIEFRPDPERPGGWLVVSEQTRQSYVDEHDPTHLAFAYLHPLAALVEGLRDGPLDVVHIGGGGATLPRRLAATRPGSRQIVLEPDAALTEAVLARLPLPPGAQVDVRPVDGRTGLAALPDDSVDVIVEDAFADGRTPADLTTVEFCAEADRVLRPDGMCVWNVADDNTMAFRSRLVATARSRFDSLVLTGVRHTMSGRLFGNLVLAARRGHPVPYAALAAAAPDFPQPYSALDTDGLRELWPDAAVLTDAEGTRSPEPPDLARA